MRAFAKHTVEPGEHVAVTRVPAGIFPGQLPDVVAVEGDDMAQPGLTGGVKVLPAPVAEMGMENVGPRAAGFSNEDLRLG